MVKAESLKFAWIPIMNPAPIRSSIAHRYLTKVELARSDNCSPSLILEGKARNLPMRRVPPVAPLE